MDIPLRVLIIEDSQRDVALEVRALEAAGYRVTFAVADTAAEMKAALARQAFDIVISDHDLPQFDAPGALAVLKQSGTDIPFIIVSGAIGEETAVALMKAGAHDYVMKDRLSLLASAVEHALQDAEDRVEGKRIEKALMESEERFRSLFDRAPMSYQSLDEEGRFIEVNQAWLETLGYNREEVIGKWFGEFLAPEFIDAFLDRFPKFKTEGKVHVEFQMLHKNGSKRFIAFEGRIGHKPDGSFQQTHCTLSDITERKQAEDAQRESEAKYRSLVETAGAGVASTDLEGKLTFVNEAFCALLGYSRQELLGEPFFAFLHPDDLPNIMKIFLNAVAGTRTRSMLEFRAINKNGQITWLYSSPTAIENKGKTIGFSAILYSITDRKKAEESLHSSETALKNTQRFSQVGGWEWNIKTNQVTWSDEMYTIFGLRKEEVSGDLNEVIARTIHPDDQQKVEQSNLSVINDKKPMPLEYRVVWPDQSVHFVWAEAGELIIDESGNPSLLKGYAQDITERKQAELRIRESEILYRSLIETSPDAIGLMDLNGTIIMHNKQALEVFGFELTEDLKGKNIMDMVTPENYKEILENMEKLQKAEVLRNSELTSYKKDGSPFYLELSSSMLFDEEGKPKSIMTIFKDITERKLSEEKLVKSYESLKKTLNDAIATMVKIVEMRDPYTAGHQHKVADMATVIAIEMKLEDTRIDQLRMAALIHDIGKMYVPSDILSKPGRLSDIEFDLIKIHSQSGYDIVKSMDFPGNVAEAVLQHHERLDGSGYPNQLKGEDMILEAKILAVADVIEAMSSHRPYRPSLGIDKALEEISKNKGKLYDPNVVDACLEIFKSGKFAFKPV